MKNDVDQHNRTAPDAIREALRRKRKLAESSTGVLAARGIPVKRRGEPPAFAVPVQRRKQPTRRPAVAAGKYEPEPVLDEKEYEHILGILRSKFLVMERDPGALATLDEENIRTHFLLQLNGHYEGGATGETFNHAGKTDILIRSGDRNGYGDMPLVGPKIRDSHSFSAGHSPLKRCSTWIERQFGRSEWSQGRVADGCGSVTSR